MNGLNWMRGGVDMHYLFIGDALAGDVSYIPQCGQYRATLGSVKSPDALQYFSTLPAAKSWLESKAAGDTSVVYRAGR